MIDFDGLTIGQAFGAVAARWPDRPFLIAAATRETPLRTLTYADAELRIAQVANDLSAAGYGPGARVAVLMGTSPEYYIVKLALARIGASCVPVNPDYRPGEIAYLLDDSRAVLAITDPSRIDQMSLGVAEAGASPPVILFDEIVAAPKIGEPAGAPDETTEASLLYTSGTTGRPKGCILSHRYELQCGAAYSVIGGAASFGDGCEVHLNPLPSFHINAGVVTLFGAMLRGNCMAQPERFSATTWWRDVAETGATTFNYLGVIISVLMADREVGKEALGALRCGIGAGVEPALHVAFEQRFGIPLIELWGMTEMCRITNMADKPRMIETRAFGRPRVDLEVRVVDGDDKDVLPGAPGEMVMRHSSETPREGFFDGYLNKPEATAEAWRGGWFHTGDTASMDEAGVLYFIDRAKNIIRRSGENIAAAEVENILLEHEAVDQVACLAAPDEVREEEVMACIVLAPGAERSEATARALFAHCDAALAYFKAPGWVLFVDALPVTGTQKLVKHKIFAQGVDPRDGAFDLRALKRRTRA
ncbi:MAG: AMP-binding protein [Pseudomonadota bacterium]